MSLEILLSKIFQHEKENPYFVDDIKFIVDISVFTLIIWVAILFFIFIFIFVDINIWNHVWENLTNLLHVQ